MLSITYAPDRTQDAGASCRAHRRDSDTRSAVPYGAGPLRFVHTGTDNPVCHVCVADGLRAGTHALDNADDLTAAAADPTIFHGHRATLGRLVAAHDAHGAVDAESLGRALSWGARHPQHLYSKQLREGLRALLGEDGGASRVRAGGSGHLPRRGV